MPFLPNQRPSAPWSNGNWWGQFDVAAQLPNVAGAPFQVNDLQAGDIAWVQATNQLFYCTDPTWEAATWSALAGGGVTTIRDAHQIVVGQTGGTYTDVAGVSADYVDTGDGVQLQAALTAAAALIVGSRTGVDVRLRPCSIVVAAQPLTMAGNIRLVGADRDASGLSAAGTVLRLTDGVNNDIQEIAFTTTADDADPTNGGTVVITGPASGVGIRRCRFTGSNAEAVNTQACIYAGAADAVSDITIEENDFNLSGVTSGGDRVGVALKMLNVQLTNTGKVRFERNNLSFGNMVALAITASSDSAVGVQVCDNLHSSAGTPQAGGGASSDAAIWMSFLADNKGVFPGPQVRGNSISMISTGFQSGPPQAIIRLVGEVLNARSVVGTRVYANALRVPSVAFLPVANGIHFVNNGVDGQFSATHVGGNTIDGVTTGVRADCSVAFTGAEAYNALAVSGGNTFLNVNTCLLLSKSAGAGLGTHNRGTFVGNSGIGNAAAQMVQSLDAEIIGFTVIANTAQGFTAFVADPSGTFEVSHNV